MLKVSNSISLLTRVKATSAMGVRFKDMWNRGTASTISRSLDLEELHLPNSTPFMEQWGYFAACRIILQ